MVLGKGGNMREANQKSIFLNMFDHTLRQRRLKRKVAHRNVSWPHSHDTAQYLIDDGNSMILEVGHGLEEMTCRFIVCIKSEVDLRVLLGDNSVEIDLVCHDSRYGCQFSG
jgi:hypothetical protein